MIQTINHRALARYYTTGSTKGLGADMVPRIRRILTLLDAAPNLEALTTIVSPGLKLHQLKGDRKGTWAMAVTGNWRITFKFDGPNVSDVDLEDYH